MIGARKRNGLPDAETDLRKKHVVTFYDLVFNQNEIREAVERYVGDDSSSNRTPKPASRASSIFFKRMARENPRSA